MPIPTATTEQIAQAQAMTDLLWAHYGDRQWQTPLDALDELVNTVLSQNTNDTNRDRAFAALKARYPDWQKVADAPLAQLTETIRSAGLAEQKATHIQQILQILHSQRGKLSLEFLKGMSPMECRAWLTALPGVGPKTAAIVMQFSLGMPAFAVDTHIYRISGRLGLRPAQLSVNDTHILLEQLLQPCRYNTLHIQLIHLGREFCRARSPLCLHCPLQAICPSKFGAI
ncbi:MAG TPA: endonuclease III [Anaerolineales bacterium]|nr:endonuclease III [Anaerolineales bacterium]